MQLPTQHHSIHAALSTSLCDLLLLRQLLSCCFNVPLELQLTASEAFTAGGYGGKLLPYLILQAN
jgi:hypothetical protein